jgi:hypothetical protein
LARLDIRLCLRRSWLIVLVLQLALSIPGCGGNAQYSGPVYPVTGKVLLSDGKPLTDGMIQFIPDSGGFLASGKIGADGTFTLTSLDKREGAAPGTYKVRIQPSLAMTAPKAKRTPPLPFNARYTDDDGDTGLTATIKAEPNNLEPFRLER